MSSTTGLADTVTPQTVQDLKARVLDAYVKQVESDTQSVSTSSDMMDLEPNAEYAQLKLKIFQRGLEKGTPSPEYAQLNAADAARIAELRNHYFFKEKDAEALFRNLRAGALAAAKQARLRDTSTNGPSAPNTSSPKKGGRKQRPPSLLPTPGSAPSTSPKRSAMNISNDSGSDGSGEGGIFGTMLDEMPTSEIVAGANGNTLIRIRDMSLPKQWGGRTPKLLLGEVVHKIDRYAAVSYSPMGGGTSRAIRSAVSVRWGTAGKQKGLPQDWMMEEDGCHDQGQSEQFIATVALHDLSFVPTPGFANPTNTGSGAQTHFRVLPPVYRDLWDELEAKRKDLEDTTNRSIWRRLKEIVEPRAGSGTKVSRGIRNIFIVQSHLISTSQPSKATKLNTIVDDTPDHWESRLGTPDQQIADNFRARQMTQAYQEMFVSVCHISAFSQY